MAGEQADEVEMEADVDEEETGEAVQDASGLREKKGATYPSMEEGASEGATTGRDKEVEEAGAVDDTTSASGASEGSA